MSALLIILLAIKLKYVTIPERVELIRIRVVWAAPTSHYRQRRFAR